MQKRGPLTKVLSLYQRTTKKKLNTKRNNKTEEYLSELCSLIGEVTTKQQHITGLNFDSKPHEDCRVQAQS